MLRDYLENLKADASFINKVNDDIYNEVKNKADSYNYIFNDVLKNTCPEVAKYFGFSILELKNAFQATDKMIGVIHEKREQLLCTLTDEVEVSVNEVSNLFHYSDSYQFFYGHSVNGVLYTIYDKEFQQLFSEINNYINTSIKYYACAMTCICKNNSIIFFIYYISDIDRFYIGMGEAYFKNQGKFHKYPAVDNLLFLTLSMLSNKFYQDKYSAIKMNNDILEYRLIMNRAVERLIKQYHLPNQEIIIYLSSLTYEKSNCNAKFVFANNLDNIKDGSCHGNCIWLEEQIYINMENSRRIRKLLEMANDGYALYATNDFLHKIEAIVPESLSEDNIAIVFYGHMKWSIERRGRKIISYENGKYTVPSIKAGRGYFISRVADYFQVDAKDEKCTKIVEIISEAAKQKHGTMLLITVDAEEVSKRLCECGRGTKIIPIDLTKNLNVIKKITSIDGTLILDEHGICYAIGVILDGIAYKYGNSGRGARYNSAYTYIANQMDEKGKWKTNPYMAVVISEDRTVDIISISDIMTDEIKYFEELSYAVKYPEDDVDLTC